MLCTCRVLDAARQHHHPHAQYRHGPPVYRGGTDFHYLRLPYGRDLRSAAPLRSVALFHTPRCFAQAALAISTGAIAWDTFRRFPNEVVDRCDPRNYNMPCCGAAYHLRGTCAPRATAWYPAADHFLRHPCVAGLTISVFVFGALGIIWNIAAAVGANNSQGKAYVRRR